LCGGQGERFASGIEDFKARQAAADAFEVEVRADALQDFAKDQVSEREVAAAEFAVEPFGVRVGYSGEVVDPDGGVDDGYRTLLPR
jgi:hypothetical protein